MMMDGDAEEEEKRMGPNSELHIIMIMLIIMMTMIAGDYLRMQRRKRRGWAPTPDSTLSYSTRLTPSVKPEAPLQEIQVQSPAVQLFLNIFLVI